MLLDFLLPSPCLYCHKIGRIICQDCLENLDLKLQRTDLHALPLYYFSEYQNVAKVVNAIKEDGYTSAGKLLVSRIAKEWPEELGQAILLPIPSAAANLKRRGFNHTTLLARTLARAVPGLTVRELLLSAKPRLDQAGLTAEQRRANMMGAYRLSPANKAGGKLVLFDDVVTTGATLTEAARTLQMAGLAVAGCCVIARVLGPERQF